LHDRVRGHREHGGPGDRPDLAHDLQPSLGRRRDCGGLVGNARHAAGFRRRGGRVSGIRPRSQLDERHVALDGLGRLVRIVGGREALEAGHAGHLGPGRGGVEAGRAGPLPLGQQVEGDLGLAPG
ncbi:MAG: hypothetical protein ACK56I_03105, partial [bacterium]